MEDDKLPGDGGYTTFLVVFGLQRARDLRPDDDYGLSDLGTRFSDILRDGPESGVHTIAWADTHGNLMRVLDRRAMNEFDMRVGFQMRNEDSMNLFDSGIASNLKLAQAILYNENEGSTEKFRLYEVPRLGWLKWAAECLRTKAGKLKSLEDQSEWRS